MTNKYSIVSFVKNEAPYYLKAMLHSIVSYAGADEIIIVDNGSTDNTVAIIRQYPQIKLLEIETSPDDIAIAINAAINEVTNDWIYIQAGDEAWLPEQIQKLPGMIDEMIDLDKRIGMIKYLDFIKDARHYHTKYICWVTKIWKNECNFHFTGDWMGEIYMGYDDGVHTGGIRTKKNLPEEQVHRREDIKLFHYARCKPVEILKEKRQRYWEKRIPTEVLKEHELQLQNMNESSIRQQWVEQQLKTDPFYTLEFGDKLAYYDGVLPEGIE